MILYGFSICVFAMSVLASTTTSSALSKIVQITEDAPKDSFVANVARILHLDGANTFKLLSEKAPASNYPDIQKDEARYFDLDRQSGIVTLRHLLDRDTLCSDVDVCTFHLKVFVVNKQQLLNLDVVIGDVNDNPPTFPWRQVIVNVSESVLIGHVINLNQFLAKDADAGSNSNLSYSISKSNYFQLVHRQATANALQLKIIKQLDYETDPIQKLTLTAQDHGNPPLSGSMELVVKISDANDNNPIFDQQVYSLDLQENLFPGFVIVRVHATDKDTDRSGVIRYFLPPAHNRPLALRLLRVDPVSGDVILKQTLDHELHDKLKVVVEARDSSLTNQRTGRAELELNVEDVNDNSPTINVDYIFMTKDEKVYVPENSPAGIFIAYVTAKDSDSGLNGKVGIEIFSVVPNRETVSIISGNPEAFRLTNDSFVAVSSNLDREATDGYDVTIKACDNGTPKKCSTKLISVILLDVNDHRPILTASKLIFTLPEDTPVHTILTTIQANDGDNENLPAFYKNENGEIDNSPYGEVFYHIIDGDGTFSIDPHSGDVSVATALDREHKSRYEITVRAKDNDRISALQSTCKIEIEVTDINDNRPRFVSPNLNVTTYYATIVRDHVIVKIQAVDYDLGNNREILYRISSVDGTVASKGSLFVIDPLTGELRLNSSNPKINESLGLHQVAIQAVDKGAFPLYNTRLIDVIITNSEELPMLDAINFKVTSPPSLLFIIVAIVSTSIVVIIVITAAVVKYNNDKKQFRTYTCGGKTLREDEWAFGTLMRMRSSSDSRAVTTQANSVLNKSDAESHSSGKRFDSFVMHPYNDISGGPKSLTLTRNSQIAGCQPTRPDEHSCYAPSSQASLEKKFPPKQRNLAIAPSPHDGDSGRGDSDPDAPVSDITNDLENRKRRSALVANQPSNRLSNRRCSEQCLLYGHSDACWMPTKDEKYCTTSSPPLVEPSSTFTSVFIDPGTADRPISRLDYGKSRCLDVISGSIPHRHGWNYPANELNAIYSDIIVDSPRTDTDTNRALLHAANMSRPMRHSYVMDDVDHLPRASSMVASTVFYQTYNNSYNSSRRKSLGSKDLCKGSSSFNLHSTSPNPSIIRSSSADFLSDNAQAISPKRSDLSDNQNLLARVSMQETEEIINNIDKLLQS